MRRSLIAFAALAAVAAPTGVALAGPVATTAAHQSADPTLIAFRGLGGGHFGSRGGFGRSRFGGGFGRRAASRGILHRIVRALAFAYILHLLFSHGGLSILLWLIVIALLVHFVRLRRRRRNQYSYR
ncbi:MAG: hypothetical protein NVSMB51_18410 [Solirubrobacteraceae bacterium]